MCDENKNIENNQEGNQNKCEDKKSCWVNDLYPLNRTILVG